MVSVIRIYIQMPPKDCGDTLLISNLFSISLKAEDSGAINYGRNSYYYRYGTLVFIASGQTVQGS